MVCGGRKVVSGGRFDGDGKGGGGGREIGSWWVCVRRKVMRKA